ncbi:MAG: hypothetical protein D3926_10835 [Desulfobacteraceae bacterium]|nr:MAG: hypothetical protein D3926_10835 [Desulfobacteraceae bacterium]
MKISVPFLTDPAYIQFLNRHRDRIRSVYFPLSTGPVIDARARFETMDIQSLCQQLHAVDIGSKYLLLNSRFIPPDRYRDSRFLTGVMASVEFLLDQGCVSGFVFTDAYLLRAIASENRDIACALEAVPGANCMIDDAQKAFTILELIESWGFRLPSKIVLDRSLNRRMDRLAQTVQSIRSCYTGVEIELLVNEGCLWYCPYKMTHDAHIALCNTGMVKNTTQRLNRELGCIRHFLAHPEDILKSPFIRPEDMSRYDDVADSLKICGRTLGPRFLKQCIASYAAGEFSGNLLELMDATHWMAEHFYIDNPGLTDQFFDRITSCTKQCKDCTICSQTFDTVSRSIQFKLKPYGEYQ